MKYNTTYDCEQMPCAVRKPDTVASGKPHSGTALRHHYFRELSPCNRLLILSTLILMTANKAHRKFYIKTLLAGNLLMANMGNHMCTKQHQLKTKGILELNILLLFRLRFSEYIHELFTFFLDVMLTDITCCISLSESCLC